MKHKNYDAETMLREYMQTINADPAAIDEILSGERQPANTGARIKHSTGKMATITAAAAVIAVCAGIGLSNMNANDDSSIKPAANQTTTTTAVTTSQHETAPQKKEDAKFKTEATEICASDHSLRITVKLTALNEKAKKLLDEDAEKYRRGFQVGERENIHVSAAANADQNKFACVSTTTPVINGNTLTTTISYQMINSTDVYNDGDKIKIMFGMNGELEEFEKCPEGRKITVAIKKNMTERVFKSASGKTLWLSDYHFNVGMDAQGMDKYTFQNFEMTFADGTVKTPFNMQCIASGGTRSDKGDPNIMFGFEKKIDKTKVTSIKYAGEVFTPQKTEDAEFKSEVTQMFASDHGLRVVVKSTALNDDAKALVAEADKQLKENLHCGLSITTADQDTSRFAGASISAPKIDGDSFTCEMVYEPNGSTNIFTDGTKCTVRVTIPGEEYKLLKNTGVAEFTIKKNMTERVFKSENGKTLWLTDYQFNCDLDSAKLTDKKSSYEFEITFADGTVKTRKDIECVGGYSTQGEKNDPNSMIAFLNKIDSSKVTSIKYAGETFTAQ